MLSEIEHFGSQTKPTKLNKLSQYYRPLEPWSDTAFVFESLSLLYLKISYFIVIFAKFPFGIVLTMPINPVR